MRIVVLWHPRHGDRFSVMGAVSVAPIRFGGKHDYVTSEMARYGVRP